MQTRHRYWTERIVNPPFLSCSVRISVIWGTKHVAPSFLWARRVVTYRVPDKDRPSEGEVPCVQEVGRKHDF
jgi:hypothetical protein